MPLSEELKALLGDKADENAIIAMLEPEATSYFESNGRIVRTKEQDESYISTQVEQLIKPRVAEIHKKYDDDIFEVLGERKAPTEKTYDFAKKKLAELKELKSGAGKGDQVLQDKIANLESTIASLKTTHATELSTLKEKTFKSSLDAKISSFLETVNIAIPAHLTTDAEKTAYLASQRQMIKSDFLHNYTPKEDENGNLVFYKGDVLQSSTKDGKPLSASDIISDSYKPYFAKEERKAGGAGGGKGGDPEKGFATRKEVYDYLKSTGIDEESKEFSDKATEYVRKYGLTE